MKYTKAFEIAQIVLAHSQARGVRFRDGVVRKAALAAANTSTDDEAADAMENAFMAARVSI